MTENAFPGSDEEKMALFRAVIHNCDCQKPLGVLTKQCSAHSLLVPDKESQSRWKHLVEGRRRAGKLLVEELGVMTKWHKGTMYNRKTIFVMDALSRMRQ